MLVGRRSARSCSGRSTLRGTGTTFGTAPPERNGGRVARARAAAASERRTAALGRLSTLRRRSGTTVGWPERAEHQRKIVAPWDRDVGRRHGSAWLRRRMIDAPRDRYDDRRRTTGAERRWGCLSAHSSSGRQTRCGARTTVGAALTERNSGRVAGGSRPRSRGRTWASSGRSRPRARGRTLADSRGRSQASSDREKIE